MSDMTFDRDARRNMFLVPSEEYSLYRHATKEIVGWGESDEICLKNCKAIDRAIEELAEFHGRKGSAKCRFECRMDVGLNKTEKAVWGLVIEDPERTVEVIMAGRTGFFSGIAVEAGRVTRRIDYIFDIWIISE